MLCTLSDIDFNIIDVTVEKLSCLCIEWVVIFKTHDYA